jgi:Ca2+/Na+ antiporter
MAARYTNGQSAPEMNVSTESAVELSVLVVVSFLFLLCLAKGSLSEWQQTRVWVLYAVLFFSLCRLLVRSETERQKSHQSEDAAPVVGTKQPSHSNQSIH